MNGDAQQPAPTTPRENEETEGGRKTGESDPAAELTRALQLSLRRRSR